MVVLRKVLTGGSGFGTAPFGPSLNALERHQLKRSGSCPKTPKRHPRPFTDRGHCLRAASAQAAGYGLGKGALLDASRLAGSRRRQHQSSQATEVSCSPGGGSVCPTGRLLMPESGPVWSERDGEDVQLLLSHRR